MIGKPDRRTALWLEVSSTSLLGLVSSGHITGSDGPAMFAVTRSLVEHATITLPSGGFPGRGGHHYATHGLGLPLLSVIPYALAWPVAHLSSTPGIEEAAVATTMPVIGGLLVAALFVLGRRLGGGAATSAAVAAGAVFGTFILPYTKDFYSEPLAALLITVAIERTVAGRGLAAGSAAAGAGLVRPQLFLFAPLVWWIVWRADRREAARAGLSILTGLALALTYNWLRFGAVLQFDPLQGSIHLPAGPLRGLGGLFFYPTKSVLLFAPVVIVLPGALAWLWRQQRAAALLLSVNLTLGLAVAAAWPAWDGGWTWGPRLLIPAVVPALAAVAPWLGGLRRERSGRISTGLVAALFVIGFAVSLPGVLVSTRAQLRLHPPAHGPSVARQYRLVLGTVRTTIRHPDRPQPEDRTLDVWQVRVRRRGGVVGAVGAAALSLTLIGVACAGAARVRQAAGAA